MNELSFNEFLEGLQDGLKGLCTSEEQVLVRKSEKVNTDTVSVLYKKGTGNVFPSFDAEILFRMSNGSYDEAMSILRGTEVPESIGVGANPSDFIESLKDKKVILQLIGRERNAEKLEKIIHVDFLDMAIIARFVIDCTEDGVTSTVITNELFAKVFPGEDPEDFIHQVAKSIQRTDFAFSSMSDVLKSMMGDEFQSMFPFGDTVVPMYVLTNKTKVNGAAVITSPLAQKCIFEALGGTYYVLPSSIHEVIIIPCGSDSPDVTYLKEMVSEVNSEQVAPNEVLTNSVYRFNGENLEIV